MRTGMDGHKNQPLSRRFGFALAGLAAGWKTEASLRFQVVVFVCVVIALILLRVEPLWWALVMLACGVVLTAELFNTALENLADHLHPEIHPRIRVVKDCAAAAVLLAVCFAGAVGIALVVHLVRR